RVLMVRVPASITRCLKRNLTNSSTLFWPSKPYSHTPILPHFLLLVTNIISNIVLKEFACLQRQTFAPFCTWIWMLFLCMLNICAMRVCVGDRLPLEGTVIGALLHPAVMKPGNSEFIRRCQPDWPEDSVLN